jgi:hypothetical protein
MKGEEIYLPISSTSMKLPVKESIPSSLASLLTILTNIEIIY